jgi:DNA-binding IclR family transcriptional regulator
MKSRRTSAGDSYGTQSVERTIGILRVIAARGRFGWRLSDLCAYCGISKGTMHRLLACLVRERLVRRRQSDRHYLPGPLLFELSLALPSFAEFLEGSQTALKRLARATGMVDYLFLRSGTDSVCAARQGVTDIKALLTEKGTRRPLLSGVGGIAMLIAMAEAESAEVIKRNMSEMERFGSERVKAAQLVLRESKKVGYAIHRGQMVPGVHAIGVAIQDSGGVPFAALTVVCPAERMPSARVPALVSILQEEAQRIEVSARRYGVTGGDFASVRPGVGRDSSEQEPENYSIWH